MFSTRGIDLLEPTLDTETVGVWLLCMQARWWTGSPSCLHPLGHTLEAPLWKVSLRWKAGSCAGVQLGQTLLSEISFRMSGELSLATPKLKLSGKWSDWNPGYRGVSAEEGRGGLDLTLGARYQTGLIPIFMGEKFRSKREGFDL